MPYSASGELLLGADSGGPPWQATLFGAAQDAAQGQMWRSEQNWWQRWDARRRRTQGPAVGDGRTADRGENIAADEFMLQPGGIDAITEFWNWINDGAGSGGVGLHGDFNMTGSYDEWETARRLVERGERKLSDYGGELPGTEPPEEWKRYFDWQRQFRLSEFGSEEWFELAQKMFDFTGDNVFVIGTVGEAPNILLTNNDLRNVPTEFPVSNTDWKGNLMYWADQLWLDR